MKFSKPLCRDKIKIINGNPLRPQLAPKSSRNFRFCPSKHRNSSMLKLLSSSSAAAYCRAQALAAPTLRTASESSSSPFFKALSELTGLNRRNRSLAHGRFFCSDFSGDGGNEGTAETKSSSAIVHKSETGGLFNGAMPGKMVQCLKNVRTANPLVLIDEIDKLGRGHAGDPASALLELLDPEQNAIFPIDLFKVLFVCTANVVEMIPNPLLDRMEVIAIAGYITDEKMHISRDDLEMTTREACGVKPEQIALQLVRQGAISESTVAEEVAEPEEAKAEGVDKSSQNTVGSDTVVETETDKMESEELQDLEAAKNVEKVLIDSSNLVDYVGKLVFHAECLYDQTSVGVVMGLAWTGMGGSTLYIETTQVEQEEGKGALHVTSPLGNVMKESAQIAHTVARAILLEKDPQNTFFANSKLHLHIPARATPKDGPSVGCTMVTSLLSLAMKKFVKKDLAMTGEITLTGRILPIGGDKEKTIAARSDIKTII
ncbi:hypothetical protein EZV62_006521 [Acer yangbiense]|uniref:Lon proteolytic domain-containing protein n=1 Tax=Acer yangbiense TaxID=1000413 RepID=A0A5C7IA27_9ROSI|nr:hypothetical protein EZV62_006521 [Acer yangbiense]